MMGVLSVLNSNSTNATKNMIDSGVAGRSMSAVACGGQMRYQMVEVGDGDMLSSIAVAERRIGRLACWLNWMQRSAVLSRPPPWMDAGGLWCECAQRRRNRWSLGCCGDRAPDSRRGVRFGSVWAQESMLSLSHAARWRLTNKTRMPKTTKRTKRKSCTQQVTNERRKCSRNRISCRRRTHKVPALASHTISTTRSYSDARGPLISNLALHFNVRQHT